MKYTLRGFIEKLGRYDTNRLKDVYIFGGGRYSEEDYKCYENTLIKALHIDFTTGKITIEIF